MIDPPLAQRRRAMVPGHDGAHLGVVARHKLQRRQRASTSAAAPPAATGVTANVMTLTVGGRQTVVTAGAAASTPQSRAISTVPPTRTRNRNTVPSSAYAETFASQASSGDAIQTHAGIAGDTGVYNPEGAPPKLNNLQTYGLIAGGIGVAVLIIGIAAYVIWRKVKERREEKGWWKLNDQTYAPGEKMGRGPGGAGFGTGRVSPYMDKGGLDSNDGSRTNTPGPGSPKAGLKSDWDSPSTLAPTSPGAPHRPLRPSQLMAKQQAQRNDLLSLPSSKSPSGAKPMQWYSGSTAQPSPPIGGQMGLGIESPTYPNKTYGGQSYQGGGNGGMVPINAPYGAAAMARSASEPDKNGTGIKFQDGPGAGPYATAAMARSGSQPVGQLKGKKDTIMGLTDVYADDDHDPDSYPPRRSDKVAASDFPTPPALTHRSTSSSSHSSSSNTVSSSSKSSPTTSMSGPGSKTPISPVAGSARPTRNASLRRPDIPLRGESFQRTGVPTRSDSVKRPGFPTPIIKQRGMGPTSPPLSRSGTTPLGAIPAGASAVMQARGALRSDAMSIASNDTSPTLIQSPAPPGNYSEPPTPSAQSAMTINHDFTLPKDLKEFEAFASEPSPEISSKDAPRSPGTFDSPFLRSANLPGHTDDRPRFALTSADDNPDSPQGMYGQVQGGTPSSGAMDRGVSVYSSQGDIGTSDSPNSSIPPTPSRPTHLAPLSPRMQAMPQVSALRQQPAQPVGLGARPARSTSRTPPLASNPTFNNVPVPILSQPPPPRNPAASSAAVLAANEPRSILKKAPGLPIVTNGLPRDQGPMSASAQIQHSPSFSGRSGDRSPTVRDIIAEGDEEEEVASSPGHPPAGGQGSGDKSGDGNVQLVRKVSITRDPVGPMRLTREDSFNKIRMNQASPGASPNASGPTSPAVPGFGHGVHHYQHHQHQNSNDLLEEIGPGSHSRYTHRTSASTDAFRARSVSPYHDPDRDTLTSHNANPFELEAAARSSVGSVPNHGSMYTSGVFTPLEFNIPQTKPLSFSANSSMAGSSPSTPTFPGLSLPTTPATPSFPTNAAKLEATRSLARTPPTPLTPTIAEPPSRPEMPKTQPLHVPQLRAEQGRLNAGGAGGMQKATPDENGFVPLSQMSLAVQQPNYRSATDSIYALYD